MSGREYTTRYETGDDRYAPGQHTIIATDGTAQLSCSFYLNKIDVTKEKNQILNCTIWIKTVPLPVYRLPHSGGCACGGWLRPYCGAGYRSHPRIVPDENGHKGGYPVRARQVHHRVGFFSIKGPLYRCKFSVGNSTNRLCLKLPSAREPGRLWRATFRLARSPKIRSQN